tara:strand:+ start:67 stop:921 length:855 start_codon:yes stop_codon:yes gene_type:complete
MIKTVYLNGKFVPDFEAQISIFDRGFLFGDSVYEVTTVLGGKLVAWEGHVERFYRSLKRLKITSSCDRQTLLNLHRQLVQLNQLKDGLIYMQVSRGVAQRDFLINEKVEPSLVLFSQEIDLLEPSRLNRRLKIITVPETRWEHRDIKTTQLLAASLMKTEANALGVDDAWFVEDGYITEGTSSNAFIVVNSKKIITRKIDRAILAGVTRFSILEVAMQLGLEIQERAFSVEEAELADEAFITSATNFIASVVEINGKKIGNGRIGSTTLLLRERYLTEIKKTAI